MREWVVGFLIDPECDAVVLIKKNRPPWQAGLLNGVGGKMEPGETPVEAMRREFAEEAGLRIGNWEEFVTLTAVSTEDRSGEITTEPGIIHFFRSVRPGATREVGSLTDEQITVVRLFQVAAGGVDTIPNLRWLVPLAAHTHDTYGPIEVTETSTTLRVSV